MTAKKYDKGKPRPDLVIGDLMPALIHFINVGTYGAFKYEPKNFMNLENGEERYADAGLRHYAKRKLGDMFDDETGEYHLAHEIWCKVAELYFYLKDRDDILVLTIQDRDSGRYYDDFGNLCRLRHWFDEEDGRQMIWSLMDKGITELKIDKRPAGEVEASPKHEARITAALTGATIPQDGTSGLCVADAEPEEGPFGVFNTVTHHWFAQVGDVTTWTILPEFIREFKYLSDAVVCIADQLGIVDQQVCEVRKIPKSAEKNAYGIWDERNKMWFFGIINGDRSWVRNPEMARDMTMEECTEFMATQSVYLNIKELP